jgi:glycosyltransferase involved in cell wall biosynthesis
VRVLYANHTSRISGAEWALLDLLAGLPSDICPVVACPKGPLAQAVGALGVPVSTVGEADASFRLHPWQTPRGVVQLVLAGLVLKRLASRVAADLIHANSVRTGLMALVSAKLGGPPVIVNVHDCLPRTRLANLVRRLLLSDASALIANSNYTGANFAAYRSIAPVTIYNPIDLGRFDPQTISRAHSRTILGLPPAAPILGLIAQITPWKGQDDAIRTAALLRQAWPDLRLLLVGDVKFASKATRFDNRAYARSLRALVDDLRLQGTVQFLGQREDVPQIMRAIDLLLVPSWEEPFGRTVIEAMAMETPVLATDVGGPSEVITDGVNGLLLKPREPQRWAAAIGGLLANPARRAEIGRRGRRTVVNTFSREAHVANVLDAYQRLLSFELN